MKAELDGTGEHPTPASLDVRCPDDPRLLFFKLRDDDSIEVACRSCRDRERARNPRVILVLHRYSPAGELLDTQALQLIPKT